MEKAYETLQETKEHGRPDFLFNIYPCTIPLDFPEVATHWHDDVELIRINKGCGIVELDFTPYEVSKGDLVLVRPGQLHAIRFSGNAPLEYENILIHPSFLLGSEFDAISHSYFLPFLHGKYTVPSIYRESMESYAPLMACIDKMDRISESKAFAWEIGIKASLFDFFFVLFDYFPFSGETANESSKITAIKAVLSYIEMHYMESITVETAASILGYSTSHFMRFFKEQTNQTFVSYLNSYRLSKAAEKLCDTSDSILAISIECGYENLSLFNRQFKRKYKMTPSGFRAMYLPPAPTSAPEALN